MWLDLIQCKNGWIFQLKTIKRHFYSQLEAFQPCFYFTEHKTIEVDGASPLEIGIPAHQGCPAFTSLHLSWSQVRSSQLEGGGEGLFAVRDITKGEVVAFYNGVSVLRDISADSFRCYWR